MLLAGLRSTESLAEPGSRGALVAVFYALTYVGFLGPSAFDALATHWAPSGPFLLAAGAAAVGLVATLRQRGTAAPRRRPTRHG